MGAAPSRSDPYYRDRYHGRHQRRRTYTNSSPYSSLSRGTLSSRGTPLLPYPYNLHPNAPVAPGGVQVPVQLPYLLPGVTSAYVYNHQTKQFVPVLVPQPAGVTAQGNALPQGVVLQPAMAQPSAQPINQFPQPQGPAQFDFAANQPIIPFPQPQIPATNLTQGSQPVATAVLPQQETINPLPATAFPVIPSPRSQRNLSAMPSAASPRMPEPIVMPSPSLQPPNPNFPPVVPSPRTAPLSMQERAHSTTPAPVPLVSNFNYSSNPLPAPPADFPIPDHLLSGTAVVLPTAPGPQAHGRSHSEPYPSSSRSTDTYLPPLHHPLPPPPQDVYDLPAYRGLTRGVMAKEVYPEGWFNDSEKESSAHKHQGTGLGRRITKRLKKLEDALVKTFGSNERDHTRATPMTRSGSVFATRPQAHGQNNNSATSPSLQRSQTYGSFTPRGLQGNGTTLPPQPQPIIIQQSLPQAGPILSNGTPAGIFAAQPLGAQPQQSRLTTPTVQMPQPTTGTFSPPIHFTSTTHPWLALHSQHSILYRDKLYPTSLHLFEAFKFLDRRNDIAKRIRNTAHPEDVPVFVRPIWDQEDESVRREWGRIVREKMDEVLYLKFTQHTDLRRFLLETGFADLIYSEPTDKFWGTTNGHGGNELGKALVRIRDRLRSEGGGR